MKYSPQEEAKRKAAERAVELIPPHIIVGLGTGSTSYYFIEKLIERCKEGLSIQVVASSEQSKELAKKGNIPLLDINTIDAVDITVDGADEIDPLKQMIKGGGGAHVREKILANMSRELIVIVDETKLSPRLGKSKLPVEIIPFAHEATRKKLLALGYKASYRKKTDGTYFITDNQNLIVDISLNPATCNPREDEAAILSIPGVVDTGFFFDLAGRVIVGYLDGSVKNID